jgi:transcriptional regulator of arginine metabolism
MQLLFWFCGAKVGIPADTTKQNGIFFTKKHHFPVPKPQLRPIMASHPAAKSGGTFPPECRHFTKFAAALFLQTAPHARPRQGGKKKNHPARKGEKRAKMQINAENLCIPSAYSLFLQPKCPTFMQRTKNKRQRLDAIKIIVSSKEISNQEELLQELRNEGFKLTQATLSRDLKSLQVAKSSNANGRYSYVLPSEMQRKQQGYYTNTLQEIMDLAGFRSLDFSGNLAVVKTRPGYASSLAYDIDNLGLHDILGSVAGDDTIMLVLREGCSRKGIKRALGKLTTNPTDPIDTNVNTNNTQESNGELH